MQSLSCDKTTCSLAKIYLDRYLAGHPSLENGALVLLAIACIRLAINVSLLLWAV